MNSDYGLIKPFGPSIFKAKIPEELIRNLNNFIDNTIKNEEQSKQLDVGKGLVGDVKQEFKLDKETVEKSGWLKFLGDSVAQWIYRDTGKKISEFRLIETWVVRQFENEYNPVHKHGGHISGVGYLKLPDSFGEPFQASKKGNPNGKLMFIHGSEMFNCKSTFSINPKVGDFYFFPNYLLHTVYPFYKKDDERRSVSFNAVIDEDIYNVS